MSESKTTPGDWKPVYHEDQCIGVGILIGTNTEGKDVFSEIICLAPTPYNENSKDYTKLKEIVEANILLMSRAKQMKLALERMLDTFECYNDRNIRNMDIYPNEYTMAKNAIKGL